MTCFRPRFLRPVLLGLTAAAALPAATPRLGLTAGAVWPTGTTRDRYSDSAGLNLGAFADWERCPGHALRLALDGMFHSGGDRGPSDTLDSSGRARSQSLTLNYVFHPRADLQGFHLVLGAGGMNMQRISGDSIRETGLKLTWNAGFGVDLNDRWGLQARYHSITDQGRNLGTVTAGLTYRF